MSEHDPSQERSPQPPPRLIEVGRVRLVVWRATDDDGSYTWHWAAHFGQEHLGLGEARSPQDAEAAARRRAVTALAGEGSLLTLEQVALRAARSES
jgi:hypothetical protein